MCERYNLDVDTETFGKGRGQAPASAPGSHRRIPEPHAHLIRCRL